MPRSERQNLIDTHVGTRVRMRRLMLGMSQTTLGEALGLTFQQIQKYESGTSRIGASRLQQIANILQVSAAFFFDDAPDLPQRALSSSPSPLMNFMATSDGLALAKAFIRISNKQMRRRIVDLVEEIVGGQLH